MSWAIPWPIGLYSTAKPSPSAIKALAMALTNGSPGQCLGPKHIQGCRAGRPCLDSDETQVPGDDQVLVPSSPDVAAWEKSVSEPVPAEPAVHDAKADATPAAKSAPASLAGAEAKAKAKVEGDNEPMDASLYGKADGDSLGLEGPPKLRTKELWIAYFLHICQCTLRHAWHNTQCALHGP